MDLDRLSVEPRIEDAWTLPSAVYTDPALFDLAKQRVFRRSWQWVGDGDSIKVPGSVHPHLLLPGTLDEPLLLTRDRQDNQHCLSNVCTHRGHLVVEHSGVETGLRCRYHGRRFGLDGGFLSMPEFERTSAFPAESDHLSRLPLETLGNLLFTSLEPRQPFHRTFAADRSRDYLVRANWALAE